MARQEAKDMLKQETLPAHGISSMEDLVIRPCAYCKGTGEVDVGTFIEDYQRCPVCEENRNVRVLSDYIKCHRCDGTGHEDAGQFIEWFVPCEKCHGTGWAPPPPVYT
jgi:DnaJ-class molecular chaperone